MDSRQNISKYATYTDAIKQQENISGFRSLENSLVKTLDYLDTRYGVYLAYDNFSKLQLKRNDMQFKIRNQNEEIMWVYFVFSDKGKYLSIEIDPERIRSIRTQLSGFDKISERHIESWPALKLIYRDYDSIHSSLEMICDCIDENNSSSVNDINTPMKPKGIIRKADGRVQCICGRCGSSFYKSPRCPECGQLMLFKETEPTVVGKKGTILVGDDVSKLKIYEIINKYFGTSYAGWMKAGYDINDDYWAWFPTITSNNVRPDGSFGGTVMWSNTLSPDKRTVISMNHDATIDDVPREERTNNIRRRRVLIFGRINGAFEFLGVFDDKLVLENRIQTWRHDRIARGIDLNTFELIP